MSYNPARFQGRNPNKEFNPAKMGTMFTDIAKNKGLTSNLPENRVKTKHGYKIDLYSTKQFSIRREVVLAGNHSGLGTNKTQNRVLIVEYGTLYVDRKVGKQVTQEQFHVGASIAFKPGDKYSYASSSDNDVQLVIVEDKDYDLGWKTLSEAAVRAIQYTPTQNTAPAMSPAEFTQLQKTSRRQAAESAGRRVPPTEAPRRANSFDVQGVNPRPSGPPPEDD